jgi:hypothetical protein
MLHFLQIFTYIIQFTNLINKFYNDLIIRKLELFISLSMVVQHFVNIELHLRILRLSFL